MNPSTLMTRSAIAAVLGAASLISACNQNSSAQQAPPPAAALPLTTASAPPIVDAPAGSQLPPAPPARLSRPDNSSDDYAYLDQASSQAYGFGDAPPDYTFDYDGYRPWVWRSDDGYERVVEPLAGGNRYYYYRPGSNYPYLIRGPDYAYGYDNGVLVVVYDHAGRVVPWAEASRRADLAGRYLARAQALYDAGQQNQHEAVAAANWSARRAELAAEQSEWSQQQSADPDWRAYHDQHLNDDEAHWYQERYRREAEAARTAQALNDVANVALYWQAAQRAQNAGRAHGQNFGGGQGGLALFGRQNAPAGPPAGPASIAPAQAFNQGVQGDQGVRSDQGARGYQGGPGDQGARGYQGGPGDQAAPGVRPAGGGEYHPGDHQAQAQAGEHPMANPPGGPDQTRPAIQAEAMRHPGLTQERQAQAKVQDDHQAQVQNQAQFAAQHEAERQAELGQQRQAQLRAQNEAQVGAQRDAVHRAELAQQHQAPVVQHAAPLREAPPPAETHAKPPTEGRAYQGRAFDGKPQTPHPDEQR